jgi:hypothetical protein
MNKPPRLTRQQLELINRKTLQYPLQIAEKDYGGQDTGIFMIFTF